MAVDCQNLIEFCKAYEQHKNMTNSPSITDPPSSLHKYAHPSLGRSKKQTNFPSPFCEQSLVAAVDVIILIFIVVVCIFVFTPYFKYLCLEALDILPLAFLLIGEFVYQGPVAYICGVLLTLAAVFCAWELYQYKSRTCDNPQCRGLKKATEFDILLESEQYVKSSPPVAKKLPWNCGLELGEDHKELEAELRRMAPPNGRTVLVLKAPCGCPSARLEVWGAKKSRKSKHKSP